VPEGTRSIPWIIVPQSSTHARTQVSFMADQHKVIAIVDDDQTMQKAIERLLAAHGFVTQVFASAEAFLDSRAANVAACLILDIHLGGMSGIELRRRLNAVRSILPVIFITAADDEETQDAATQVGCVAYLRKPFSAKLLMSEIGKATS
jgi:FixJ family two-component response regulator